MTLATMLLVSIFCASSALPAASSLQNAQPAEPATKPGAAATQGQGTTQPQNPPAQKPSSKTQPTTTKRPRHHKKRVLAVNCTPAAAASGSNPAPTDPPSAATAPAPGSSGAPTNCPPSKVIVRQGGTSEPSIQLAGGAAGQTSHERDTANQMLGTTEANLKKVAERQLSPNEQDMVNQARQFMEQSKAAVAAGDLERARTLAWKAQLLSEELVKPEK